MLNSAEPEEKRADDQEGGMPSEEEVAARKELFSKMIETVEEEIRLAEARLGPRLSGGFLAARRRARVAAAASHGGAAGSQSGRSREEIIALRKEMRAKMMEWQMEEKTALKLRELQLGQGGGGAVDVSATNGDAAGSQ